MKATHSRSYIFCSFSCLSRSFPWLESSERRKMRECASSRKRETPRRGTGRPGSTNSRGAWQSGGACRESRDPPLQVGRCRRNNVPSSRWLGCVACSPRTTRWFASLFSPRPSTPGALEQLLKVMFSSAFWRVCHALFFSCA